MNNHSVSLLSALLLSTLTASTLAADWNQWRGPNRSGVSTESVALPKSWPQAELPKLWESEETIPGEVGFGFSSPVICDGKVYLFVAWKQSEPLLTQKLNEQGLRELGWNPVKLPEEMSQKVEAARVSEERAQLQGDELTAWIQRWQATLLANTPPGETRVQYDNIINSRLRGGKGATDLAVLEKLATIKDQTFATRADLEKWLTDNSIGNELQNAVFDKIPTSLDTTRDTVLCVSGSDGKTLWKTVLKKEPPTPLPFKSWGVSATPCVVDGKVYVNGLDGVYCLDAKTGKELWRNEVGGGSSSPCVVGDKVIVQSIANTKRLRALSALDGKEIWSQPKAGCENSSPVAWQEGQETYLLCNDGQSLHCVALKDGSILWSVEGSGPSTPVIGDGYVVVQGNNAKVGLMAYKLGKETPAKAWSIAINNSGSSPIIYKGHVYAEGRDRTICAELATGKIAWEQKPTVDTYASPAIVDGLMFMTNPQTLTVLNADPADGKVLGKMRIAPLRCTSVAIADGKLVLRSKDRIVCYDLVSRPATPEQK